MKGLRWVQEREGNSFREKRRYSPSLKPVEDWWKGLWGVLFGGAMYRRKEGVILSIFNCIGVLMRGITKVRGISTKRFEIDRHELNINLNYKL